jgi:anti-sigma factor ChrR (cupin superfamily)
MADVEAHIAGCADCRRELSALTLLIDLLAGWPVDVTAPSASLWNQLLDRIADAPSHTAAPDRPQSFQPEWEEVAPGITCKVLASDLQRDRVSMLVRLGPGVEYPAHTHSGVEELHLLQGELWIDQRKLRPGDYYRAEPRSTDRRVWSETGCTCFLLASPSDALG